MSTNGNPSRSEIVQAAKQRLFDSITTTNYQDFLSAVDDCKNNNLTRDEWAEILNSTTNNSEGWTLLSLAMKKNQVDIIKWLLSDDGGRALGFSNIFGEDKKTGATALHLGVGNGFGNACQTLLAGCKVENGERERLVNARTKEGLTILHYAVAHIQETSVITWILSDKPKGARAAGFSRESILAQHIRDGKTALHVAVELVRFPHLCEAIVNGCSNVDNGEIIELLSIPDEHGWTPLHHAANNGIVPITSCLLSAVGDEHCRCGSERNNVLFALTNDKESILHIAARRGSVGCFEEILARCSSRSEKSRLLLGVDKFGWNLFHIASRFRCMQLILHLLQNYPEESQRLINARDLRGMTALHRNIIGGNDDQGKIEWRFAIWSINFFPIAALLGMDADTQTTAKFVVSGADPNVGLKFD